MCGLVSKVWVLFLVFGSGGCVFVFVFVVGFRVVSGFRVYFSWFCSVLLSNYFVLVFRGSLFVVHILVVLVVAMWG